MVIGVPKEIKAQEYRVSVTPAGAAELAGDGNRVLVEGGAGLGSGFSDREYSDAGATIATKARVFAESGLIVKVKEPLPEELKLFRRGQALFTYLHLAPNPVLTKALIDKYVTALGYETLEEGGTLPLLAPMSEIAGRMSPIVAAYFLQKPFGGSGVLPTGAVGAPPANAVILGAGVVGANAARVAFGIGMRVTVINRGLERLRYLDDVFMGKISTLPSTGRNIREQIKQADVVIGAVLVAGARAPVLITKEMLKTMRKGSVLVDVSIDQGGCFETSRPTTHDNPVFEVAGIVHYCVANMPGAYPRTSTIALTNATLPFVRRLADLGIKQAISSDAALRGSLNVHMGKITHKGLRGKA